MVSLMRASWRKEGLPTRLLKRRPGLKAHALVIIGWVLRFYAAIVKIASQSRGTSKIRSL